jgi:DNA-binding SARP family transcriptional activator/tetratricopeptide (TPR) repeat protein
MRRHPNDLMPKLPRKSIHALLIGPPQFRCETGASLPVTPKLAALVAYLDARHPAMVPRSELMDLLWERLFEQQARQNLRKAINRLRGILGKEIFLTRGDLVGLQTDIYGSDALDLRRYLAETRQSTEAVGLDEIAAAEYLAGLDIDGERWNDWLTLERQDMQERLLRAFTSAACRREDSSDIDGVIRFAERAMKVNRYAEEPRRIRMRALARAGRDSEAAQEYNQFARMLRAELDVEPSPDTRALLQEIQGPTAASPSPVASNGPARHTLLVLPIHVLGEAANGRHLAVGLAAEIVTTLAKLSRLDIVDLSARDPASADQRSTGLHQHSAATALKSALQIVGDRVRLTVQLIEAGSDRQIWAERYDRRLANLLDIQDALTKDIVTQLQVRLTEGEQARIWSSGTASFEAWEAVVRATHLIHAHRRDGIGEARRLAEAATERDPGYATAHAAMGWTHWVEGRWSWSADRRASFRLARHLARTALSLDATNPDARSLHGVVQVHLGAHEEAIEEMERAVGLAPSHAHIAALAAYVHRYAGDPRRAVDLIDRAIWLSPGHPAWYLNTKGGALAALGARDEAEAVLREAHARDPEFLGAAAVLASVLGQGDKLDEARELIRRLMRLDPTFSVTAWSLQSPYRDAARWRDEREGLLRAGAPP